MIDTDQTLVQRSQGGDRQAFEELLRRTGRLVYARIFLQTGCPQRSQDLAQETFLSAWKRIGQLKDAAQFRSWVLAIAHSAVIDAARYDRRGKRAGTISGTGELAGVPDAEPGPADRAERDEQRRRVLAALQQLPESYRLPLTMRFLMDADYETIAQQLALSNGSLRGLLHRGLAMLRIQLQDK